MYWSRTGSGWDSLALALFLAVCVSGGWLIVRTGFRLAPKDRLVVGASLGLSLTTWMANLLARWMDPLASFWLSPLLILALAGVMWWKQTDRRLRLRQELAPWLLFAAVLALAYLFFRMGRAVAIFDDRKNLSLISLMAAGDIPPHFYMNPDFLFRYHYAFQLLGAMVMRIGGLFPWSAFDLTKGITGALAVGLCVVLGRRVTHRWAGGAALGLIVLFASGARWMLLLAPTQMLSSAARGIALWGSAAQTAPDLLHALTSGWALDGGPVVSIPFAFVNGVFQPFILNLQTGPASLGLIELLLMMILYPSRSRRWSWVVLAILLALWGLAAEAEFAAFAVGGIAAGVLFATRRGSPTKAGEARALLVSVAAGLALALVQGGTLTEAARGMLGWTSASAPGVGISLAGFSLRTVPAIVSSHLGELRLGRPGELAIGLFEVGPALLLAPIAGWQIVRGYRRRRLFPLAFGISTLVGFLLPIFIRYEVDRDISRLTHYALLGWILLAAGPVAAAWRRGTPVRRGVMLTVSGILVFGGLVVTGPLLASLPRAVLSDRIQSIDAGMSRLIWDQLEPGGLVLDSDPWRAVALTGRLTRSAADSSSQLPEWEQLVARPEVPLLRGQGYGYVYVDRFWWNAMSEEARDTFLDPCVRTVAEGADNGLNGRRWLFDIRSCASR